MDALNLIYLLKVVFGLTDWYLGANVEKIQLLDGWVVSSKNCVDNLNFAIGNINNPFGVDKAALKYYVGGHRPY